MGPSSAKIPCMCTKQARLEGMIFIFILVQHFHYVFSAQTSQMLFVLCPHLWCCPSFAGSFPGEFESPEVCIAASVG